MFHGDKKVLMVFKKNLISYKFYSVEVATKHESGLYIGQAGIFKGKKIIVAPHFTSADQTLLFNTSIANIFMSAGDISDMDDYVYYEVPEVLYNLFEKIQVYNGKPVVYEILCELGKCTEFVYEKATLFLVTHTEPLKFKKEIEELKDLLLGIQPKGIDIGDTFKETVDMARKVKESFDLARESKELQDSIYQALSDNPKRIDIIKNKMDRLNEIRNIVEGYNMNPVDPISTTKRQVDEKIEVEQILNPETVTNPLGIDVNKLISDIKAKIVGQDEAVESVVANIYANQRIIATGNKDLISTQKASILIDGSTGTGKTAIVKEVADKLSLPMATHNATSFSATGYVGDSITDILVDLYKKANGNLELAQRGIVCVDEIDKLGGFSKEKELSMRKAFQQELLGFISGAKYNIEIGGHMGPTIEFDTTNLTFIGAGAFTSIRDQKIEEKRQQNKKTKTIIGFVSDAEESKNEEVKNEDKTYVMDAQDYIKYGLERELVGRFSLLTSTKTYSKEDYRRILLESEISPLKTFIDFAKSFGVEEVNYDDEFIDKASEMAYEANFGARGLHQIISNLKNILLIDIINNKSKTITLTVNMLDKVKEKNIRIY